MRAATAAVSRCSVQYKTLFRAVTDRRRSQRCTLWDWSSAADACRSRRTGLQTQRQRRLRSVHARASSTEKQQQQQVTPASIAAEDGVPIAFQTAQVRSAAEPGRYSGRLFSNLNPATLQHEPGTVWGAAALVAGTTVGAGILALPAVTAESGFAASSAALTACCTYSIITGLLVAEVNINTLCELGGRGVSLSSMARRTLGDAGAVAVSATYALLHYALLVAYIAKAGETLEAATGLPLPLADAAFVALFGGLCFAARPALLDQINSGLVVLVVASFLGLLGAAATDVRPEQLAVANWHALPDALPVIALAFVYQNVVPVISTSLEGDVSKIRQAVVAGSALPWLMFIAWEAAILGSGSLDASNAADAAGAATAGAASAAAAVAAADFGDAPAPAVVVDSVAAAAAADPLAALREAGGPLVGSLINAFTLLAIITSFIGFVLGLSEFMADVLQLPSGQKKALPYVLTLAPPLALALSFPQIFFNALDFAGTFGVLVLFGLIPVAMVWSERYGGTTLSRYRVVPGGRPLLLGVAGAAACVIGREVLLMASASVPLS